MQFDGLIIHQLLFLNLILTVIISLSLKVDKKEELLPGNMKMVRIGFQCYQTRSLFFVLLFEEKRTIWIKNDAGVVNRSWRVDHKNVSLVVGILLNSWVLNALTEDQRRKYNQITRQDSYYYKKVSILKLMILKLIMSFSRYYLNGWFVIKRKRDRDKFPQ